MIFNEHMRLGREPGAAADDRVFLGEGLFETIRVENHQPRYTQLHWQRMSQAAAMLHIPFELSSLAWDKQLRACIDSAGLKDGGVKVVLSGGSAPRGLTTQAETSTLLAKAFSYPLNEDPLSLVSADWQRDANNPVYQFKSIGYLEAVLARRQALHAGADDALFFNTMHHATETTVANLFIIKDNQVITPALRCGVLAGVIRQRLFVLCADAGIACTETMIERRAILDADAVFVTNSLQGIRSVKSIDGFPVPVNHRLVTVLRNLLAVDYI